MGRTALEPYAKTGDGKAKVFFYASSSSCLLLLILTLLLLLLLLFHYMYTVDAAQYTCKYSYTSKQM